MAGPHDVPAAVRELAVQLSEPRPMRRGSVSERYVKCGKPGCSCADRPEARHGPYYSLTRSVAGRTRSRFLRPQRAELVARQVEAGRQFRRQVEAYWELCEQWADAQLEGCESAPQDGVKKKGSRRPSTRKSSGRLKRS